MAQPTLAQLRTLVAIVDAGGFEAAARALHVSPSSVSQRVRALESALGRVVLHRTTPPELTEPGRALLPYARRVVTLTAQAAHAASGSKDSARAVLPLAVNADSLSTWFLHAVATWEGRARTDVRLERVDQDHAAAALASGRVLGAVTTDPQALPGCSVRRLGVMRYVPVAAPGFLAEHALVPGRAGLAERLSALPVVDYDADDGLQRGFLAAWLGGHRRPTWASHPRGLRVHRGDRRRAGMGPGLRTTGR